ncbi:MAG: hypothetical protein Rpha_0371 [Candidatus Ruthia sp. Apha_13_S6]|nr:hypothetical protein [Candidatus Ruthia sp. Apha_13_S6]
MKTSKEKLKRSLWLEPNKLYLKYILSTEISNLAFAYSEHILDKT